MVNDRLMAPATQLLASKMLHSNRSMARKCDWVASREGGTHALCVGLGRRLETQMCAGQLIYYYGQLMG